VLILLEDSEGQNAMGPTTRIVHIVRRHYLVLEPLVEVLEGVLHVVALKDVHVLDGDLVSVGIQFHFEAGDTFELFLAIDFVGLRIEKVVHFLVVQLDILYVD
jgi:hypothetical protein